MSEASGKLALPQILEGVGAQLSSSLQDLHRLEDTCLKACAGESATHLQDFDRITQVLGQLAQCCEQLSHESGVREVKVQRSIVDRLTLSEVRQRLLAGTVQVSPEAGEMELF
ncbi:hypothetical protein HKD27_00335 [Gluconobacter sp. R75690]|uniref:hypothetical protein n=1 Tax=unclassified Gluconobacter TaxID=2644261 RepID=UPI001889CA3F|nr:MULTISPECIES: hypothetical protein [unclassified Gluconobacter]MBF0849373.1 hypothetical protein [Gluconobacter sp. R75690]MBF0878398.1 hypothetical protein [Gluconobacter sp. R75828]